MILYKLYFFLSNQATVMRENCEVFSFNVVSALKKEILGKEH